MPWARLAGNHRTDVNDVCRPLRLGGWPKIPNRALLPDFSFHTHFGLDGRRTFFDAELLYRARYSAKARLSTSEALL
jgi:hypothetical protein